MPVPPTPLAAPAPARWTLVGPFGPGRRAAVDAGGRVTVAPGSWALDWSVGAEDRWHHPIREPAVRQALVDGSPVIETRLRVPGGDMVHRVYAVQGSSAGDGLPLLVVDITNLTAVPVALALEIGPDTVTTESPGPLPAIDWDGTTVSANGDAAMLLPRTPGQVETGPPLRLVFPLTHTATFRAVLPLAPGATAFPEVLPDGDAVARGWAAQAARGVTLQVPDPTLQEALDAASRSLLLAADGPTVAGTRAEPPSVADRAAVARALDQWGFADEAGHLLAATLADLAADGYRVLADVVAVAAAAADHVAEGDDPPFLAAAADALVDVALVARKRGVSRRASTPDRLDAARALDSCRAVFAAAGDDAAARQAALDHEGVLAGIPVLQDEVGAPGTVVPTVGQYSVGQFLEVGRPTWAWSSPAEGHDPALTARFLSTVRQAHLVDDDSFSRLRAPHTALGTGGSLGGAGLVLLPSVPAGWLGRSVDVRGMPTRGGKVSFAVRWHGDRPALLWEVDRPVDGLVLRCGLDAGWEARAASGEALLTPPAPDRTARVTEGESFR